MLNIKGKFMTSFNYNFLKLGKSDNRISLDNFDGQISKNDIKDSKLLILFDFFDVDKNGFLNSCEINSLWNQIVTKAESDGNSIFEKSEAKSFLDEAVNENGESLKNLGIKFKDLFNFLNVINENKITDINNPDTWDILSAHEQKDEVVQKAGYNELENLLNDTSDNFIDFLKTEGCISHFVNLVRNGNKHANREDVEITLEVDAEKCKYYDEFKNAGISEGHIPYAYNNPAEFIAVAAEGDMTKYSDEFKKVLIDFGMPEWMLKLPSKPNASWFDKNQEGIIAFTIGTPCWGAACYLAETIVSELKNKKDEDENK